MAQERIWRQSGDLLLAELRKLVPRLTYILNSTVNHPVRSRACATSGNYPQRLPKKPDNNIAAGEMNTRPADYS